MPVLELVRHLADLDLDGYRVSASLPGHSLTSMSTTPGVRVVDLSRSNAGRSCSCQSENCYTCFTGVCICAGNIPCGSPHED